MGWERERQEGERCWGARKGWHTPTVYEKRSATCVNPFLSLPHTPSLKYTARVHTNVYSSQQEYRAVFISESGTHDRKD
jgi:hypothetical protein